MRVKYIKKGTYYGLSTFPSFHRAGSIKGMKKHFYGEDALLVRSGSYIYNVTSDPDVYHDAAV